MGSVYVRLSADNKLWRIVAGRVFDVRDVLHPPKQQKNKRSLDDTSDPHAKIYST